MDLIREAGYEPLPAGVLAEADFSYFANKILDAVRAELDIAGIFLHLHGAQENIGSGDLRLAADAPV